jgi:hypothetical protein
MPALIRAALIFLGDLLIALIPRLINKVLAALGFSLIAVKGFDLAIDSLKNAVVSGASGLPADVMNLFFLAGGGVCLNIIFAAITFRVTLWTLTQSTRFVGKSSS